MIFSRCIGCDYIQEEDSEGVSVPAVLLAHGVVAVRAAVVTFVHLQVTDMLTLFHTWGSCSLGSCMVSSRPPVGNRDVNPVSHRAQL
jgi:hypothetical protein